MVMKSPIITLMLFSTLTLSTETLSAEKCTRTAVSAQYTRNANPYPYWTGGLFGYGRTQEAQYTACSKGISSDQIEALNNAETYFRDNAARDALEEFKPSCERKGGSAHIVDSGVNHTNLVACNNIVNGFGEFDGAYATQGTASGTVVLECCVEETVCND